ncbi:PEP-CTERM sorting domain-containing protein [Paludibaculum fermentans]|uniref:PEP-CTERM sorting domain-containing protein n=1 Tax=Paludibaculum fermentans TaxID=1473598 RepID=UPI003EBD0942
MRSAVTGKSKSLDSRLFAYALAGGAALVSATPANAAVIHYGGPTLDTAGSSFNLDLDGDLVNDFTFQSGAGDSATTFDAVVSFPGGGVTDPLAFATPVNATTTFNATSPYKLTKGAVDQAGVVTSSGGPYAIAPNQYMGLTFDIGGVAHYGWARLEVYGTGTPEVNGLLAQGQLDVRLMEYAYETNNRAGIAVGQTSSVPEPSSLALFALGAAGIAAMRRRKAAK